MNTENFRVVQFCLVVFVNRSRSNEFSLSKLLLTLLRDNVEEGLEEEDVEVVEVLEEEDVAVVVVSSTRTSFQLIVSTMSEYPSKVTSYFADENPL